MVGLFGYWLSFPSALFEYRFDLVAPNWLFFMTPHRLSGNVINFIRDLPLFRCVSPFDYFYLGLLSNLSAGLSWFQLIISVEFFSNGASSDGKQHSYSILVFCVVVCK